MLPSFIESVKVVSLPQSHERRERLGSHLGETLNLSKFDFHDAFGPDHPAVVSLYSENKVARYPPCFRCGDLDCGKPDCNNVLIPEQVANFATYLKLWEEIAASQRITLVLEDDVFIHEWAMDVLSKLAADVQDGKVGIVRNKPHLIRLGWALGRDHDASHSYRLSNEVKMSNPAYILTPAYAAAMIRRFEMVSHTSDVFAHKLAVRRGEATTVFPPIASDLSWSTGAVESTIHPKPIRSQWLLKNNKVKNAELNDVRIRQHVKHMFHRPLLITGHPRCGTGFAASLCRQLGLDVGHEGDGKHGLSSWMMAVDADENPWASSPVALRRRALKWDVLIHVVRDLETAIPSVMRENKHAPISLEFRRKHILKRFECDLLEVQNPLEQAALSVIYWNRLIREMKPDFVLTIGGEISGFVDKLQALDLPVAVPPSLDMSPVNNNKFYNGKKHPLPTLTQSDWCEIGDKTMAMLIEEAALIGCTIPSSRATVAPSRRNAEQGQ